MLSRKGGNIDIPWSPDNAEILGNELANPSGGGGGEGGGGGTSYIG